MRITSRDCSYQVTKMAFRSTSRCGWIEIATRAAG